MAEAKGQRVQMGIITGAHGVKGEVRVKSFTAEPAAIAEYGPLEDEWGARRFALELTGTVRGMLIARIPGIADRNAAERLAGTGLFLDRAALPKPGEDEFYHADLIGLAAVLKQGGELGRVRAVHDYGAGDSLEVEKPDGGTVMVPFTETIVPEIDIAGGRLVVDPPPGLLDNRPVEAELEDEEKPQ
ncbi:MAG TPA: ribosome maturation factor RimM [Stellaceae bacterium]|nr:ribosome maturation factor RimM [Stellaceae bacterium]